MVDTQTKYGLTSRNAILLFVQMILIVAGLIIQTILTVFMLVHQLEPLMIVTSIMTMLALVAIIIYAVHGFRKSRIYLIVAIALFLLAILFNFLLPKNGAQLVLLLVIFACMFAFIFEHKNVKVSNYLVLVAAVASLGYSIYTSIIANVNAYGNVGDLSFASFLMYASIFTPVIMICTFGISHLVRSTRRGE